MRFSCMRRLVTETYTITRSSLFQQAAIFVVPESCSLTNRLFL